MFFEKNYHQYTYQKDEKGAYKIIVSLNKYEDIYSDWDPSPFRRRDIEEDFTEYIWDSALDIPLREEMVIVFLLKENIRDEKKEQQFKKALVNHYTYSLQKSQRKYFEEQKKSLRYLVFGIVFAILAYSNIFGGVELWTKVFEEGIVVGTWVFFWEALYIFSIECKEIREEQKLMKKFLKTKFIFESVD